jgi:hypothetical protein
MTPHELKFHVEQTGSFFFTRDSMRFFGDTMRNYGVSTHPVEVVTPNGDVVLCWELYRRRPVRHGVSKSAYFACDSFRQVFPAE